MKLPSDRLICEAYAGKERVYHAVLIKEQDHGSRPDVELASLCGKWKAKPNHALYAHRRWGEGRAGMYSDQRWCEECQAQMPSVRRKLDTAALRELATHRIGKGKKTRPPKPKPKESFAEKYRAQAELWVRATGFPFLGPEDVPASANIDVEWRCTRAGHSNYFDQPSHVIQYLSKGKKPCPFCRAGLKRPPWTKARLLALVRSIAEHMDSLSAADRYQLLLQTGILDSSGVWADTITGAVLGGVRSGRQVGAALKQLATDVDRSQDNARSLGIALAKLFRETTWATQAQEIEFWKLSRGRSLLHGAALSHWLQHLSRERQIEALHSLGRSPGLRNLYALWRNAPRLGCAGPKFDAFRELLWELYSESGISISQITGPTSGNWSEARNVRSLLEHLGCTSGLPDDLSHVRRQLRFDLRSAESYVHQNVHSGHKPPADLSARVAELERKLSEEPKEDSNEWILARWLDTHDHREKVEKIREVCGDAALDLTPVRQLWSLAPVDAETDAPDRLRSLLREAFPTIDFVDAEIQPPTTATEVLEAWTGVNLGAPGEILVENMVDDGPNEQGQRSEAPTLPSDEVGEILDTSAQLIVADYEEEAIDYFLASQTAKLWSVAFDDFQEALAAAREWNGTEFGNLVRDRFLEEAGSVEALPLPADWAFRPDGVAVTHPPVAPRPMQRLTAVRLRDSEGFGIGNWSLMGGGKTLSAILAAATLEAPLTVVVCPNPTVEGWCREILRVFPSAGVSTNWAPPRASRRRFVVLNIEQFQLPSTEERVMTLLGKETPRLVVLDEIHRFKRRDKNLSRRRQALLAFLSAIAERDSAAKVLGLSGTPVINNLEEARSLIELCTMVRHGDLDTTPTVANAMRIYSRLTRLGLRYRPNYMVEFAGIEKLRIDVGHRYQDLVKCDRHAAELILLEEKTATIASAAQRRSVVYSELVTDVHGRLGEAIRARGLTVGFFSGPDKAGLDKFKRGEVDCLVASSAIGTGVDGLQGCTDMLIVATLPWTSSDFDQLLGRFFRPKADGTSGHVRVLVPWTFISRAGASEWSMDAARWRRIEFKASLADTAVDGVLPKGELRTPDQAFKDLQTWLKRLEGDGADSAVARPVIRVPLSSTARQAVARRVGDLTRFHAALAASNAETTHERLLRNPEEWAWYHTEVEEAAKEWPFRPADRCIEWIEKRALRRSDLVVADLGCGLGKIQQALRGRCIVHSFDHVAYDNSVTVANIAEAIPLSDGSVDVVVLSLALDWQKDWQKCLREATRILALDGQLLLWETPTFIERVGGLGALRSVLEAHSLQVIKTFEERFVGFVGLKV